MHSPFYPCPGFLRRYAFGALLLAAFALVIALQGQSPLLAQGPGNNPDQAGEITALEAMPAKFSYQGILRRADGSLATGPHSMTLRIYDQVSGGALLHQESFTNVPVRDGVFTVLLGDAAAMGANVFADAPRYLGISVGGDPEMTPRQSIYPVPWALLAQTAQQATLAQQATTLVPGATVNGLNVGSYAQGNQYVRLATAGGNQYRSGIRLWVWQDNWGFTIENDERHVSNGLNILRHNGDAAGASTLFIERSSGNVTIAEDLMVKAIRDVGNAAGQATRQRYDTSLRRYVVEAQDGGTTPNSVPVDHALLMQLCGDVDGCSVTLGMRDFVPGRGNGTMATLGPLRLSIGSEVNGQRYWDVRWQNGDVNSNWDGNGQTNHLIQAWNCFLTDGRYSNGNNLGDPEIGLALLNWHGEYDRPEMVCVLIIED